MTPLTQHIFELQKQIDELEWAGDFDKADNLKYSLLIAQRKLEQGELYEPNF